MKDTWFPVNKITHNEVDENKDTERFAMNKMNFGHI